MKLTREEMIHEHTHSVGIYKGTSAWNDRLGVNINAVFLDKLFTLALASLDKQEAVEGLVKFVESITTFGGPYPELNGTAIVYNANQALAAYRAQADKGVR